MARFLRSIFMNTDAECDWLRATALTDIEHPVFASFQLHGNEDAPARVELFAPRSPAYNTKPIAVFTRNADGDLGRVP